MKGSLLWKLAYVFCALAGILAGYGVFSLTGIDAKDNTLVRDTGDSVFFDVERTDVENGIPEFTATPVPTAVPLIEATALLTIQIAPTAQPEESLAGAMEVLPELPEITTVPEQTVSDGQVTAIAGEEGFPSLGSRWAEMGSAVIPQQEVMHREAAQDEIAEITKTPVTEVITYPAKIFGQTPIINRSDAYVSYFEFCYDLIAMVEQKVEARGLNINVLMTKFALKALLCGVDIEKLDINAPIPRRLAALCLWLAAQVLNESGCDTSSQSAGTYVTDISACSLSEKKAIAYLYEQGVIKGYPTAGQKFNPESGLKNEEGQSWLSAIQQCWK